ncbi:phosphoribosylanthranilate isomerase [Nocardia tengchongensis]|uniref:phosphoribosylanthranilate isomerase n=1 Tax=Nocardia tengchongensis TaxID=2055889 RepID=UPI003696BC05
MFVKVCGLTTEEQIDWAVELGYTAIGVVGTTKSKRYVEPARARELAAHARGKIRSFVVAFDRSEVDEVIEDFDVIQLYNWTDLPNLAYCSSVPPEPEQTCEYFFYDASAGSGVFAEFPDWLEKVPGQVVLAGGLTPDNVAEVVAAHRPFGVDVSSSLETAPGIKSFDAMRRFIEAAT